MAAIGARIPPATTRNCTGVAKAGRRRPTMAVKKAAGVELDKRKIDLDEPIKMLGEYRVQVKVHPEVSAQLTVRVVEAQGEDA